MIELWQTSNESHKIYFKDLDDLVNAMQIKELRDSRGIPIKSPTKSETKKFVHLCLTQNLFFFYNEKMVQGKYK